MLESDDHQTTRVTVSTSRGGGLHVAADDGELVFSSLSRGGPSVQRTSRGRTVSSSADLHASQPCSAPVERGDVDAVRTALRDTSRLYGTSTSRLVEAMRLVAPPALGAPLVALSC